MVAREVPEGLRSKVDWFESDLDREKANIPRHGRPPLTKRVPPPRGSGLDTDCLIWLGQRSSSGYGYVLVAGRRVSTHTFAFEIANGPVPRGLECCHRCDVRACLEATHLFAGTHRQNMEDMARKNRARNGGVLRTREWAPPVVGPELHERIRRFMALGIGLNATARAVGMTPVAVAEVIDSRRTTLSTEPAELSTPGRAQTDAYPPPMRDT